MSLVELHNKDCLEVLRGMTGNSVDAIATDPPYLYLNHILDRPFDENLFFSECYRVLKHGSFLLFFGRGESFYRWNAICSGLAFKFKEELIWDKTAVSSPVTDLMRTHETIAVYAKGNARLNKVNIDKIDYDLLINPANIGNDLKRIVAKLNSFKANDDFLAWRDSELFAKSNGKTTQKHSITLKGSLNTCCNALQTLRAHTKGKRLNSILRVNREHYQFEHPTQKPVLLMQHLINLVSKENDLILDPFMGSGTTGVACKKLNRNFIGCELHTPYFEIAENRIAAVDMTIQTSLDND